MLGEVQAEGRRYEFNFWPCGVGGAVRWPSQDVEYANGFMAGSSGENLGWRYRSKSHQYIDNN